MLEIQKYLKANSWNQLSEEFGLKLTDHPSLPLKILNYDQINSKAKTHPIVREARSLVLDFDGNLISRSFPRFFNVGEVPEEFTQFDWSDFITQEKLDGSLVSIFYYGDSWHIRTRGSWADGLMQFQDFTWENAILKGMELENKNELDKYLDRALTYVCEFCSPYNKIVRRYEFPHLYFLTAFEGERELHWDELRGKDENRWAELFWFPRRHHFSSIEEIQDFVKKEGEKDKTWEGVVIRDKENRRWKVKNGLYIALSRIRGEGDNLFHPKYLIPFILANEGDELLTYFSEVKDQFYKLKDKLDKDFEQLLKIWREFSQIENQKEFACSIKDRTPYTSLLFNLRKRLGSNQKESDLREAWKNSEDLILKVIK